MIPLEQHRANVATVQQHNPCITDEALAELEPEVIAVIADLVRHQAMLRAQNAELDAGRGPGS